jgi:hypothetical protein
MAASGNRSTLFFALQHMTRIFISHAKEDKRNIIELMEQLVSHGFHLWLDRVYEDGVTWSKHHPIRKYVESLTIGQVWHLELGEALYKADSLVVFWSKNSVDQSKKPIILMEVAVHLFRGTAYQYYLDDAELPKDVRSQHQFARASEPGSFEALIGEMVRKLRKPDAPWTGNEIDTDPHNVRAYWELLQGKEATGPARSSAGIRIPMQGSHFWLSRRDQMISAKEFIQLVAANPHLKEVVLKYDECRAAFTPGGHDWGQDHPFGLLWGRGDATFCTHNREPGIFRHGAARFETITSNMSASFWVRRAK